MKVVATKPGVYNQILREPGEVFALLTYPDGSFPKREDWVPKIDPATKKEVAGEGQWMEFKDKKGQPRHRDLALDEGMRTARDGPARGETFEIGWMKVVPDHIAEGFYPVGTNFWNDKISIPQGVTRDIGQGDKRAAQIVSVLTPLDEAV